jgi:hypothetical protein
MDRWTQTLGTDRVNIEVENDRMEIGEPECVTVYIDEAPHPDRPGESALICLTPEQAHEVATSLRVFANLVTERNKDG